MDLLDLVGRGEVVALSHRPDADGRQVEQRHVERGRARQDAGLARADQLDVLQRIRAGVERHGQEPGVARVGRDDGIVRRADRRGERGLQVIVQQARVRVHGDRPDRRERARPRRRAEGELVGVADRLDDLRRDDFVRRAVHALRLGRHLDRARGEDRRNDPDRRVRVEVDAEREPQVEDTRHPERARGREAEEVAQARAEVERQLAREAELRHVAEGARERDVEGAGAVDEAHVRDRDVAHTDRREQLERVLDRARDGRRRLSRHLDRARDLEVAERVPEGQSERVDRRDPVAEPLHLARHARLALRRGRHPAVAQPERPDDVDRETQLAAVEPGREPGAVEGVCEGQDQLLDVADPELGQGRVGGVDVAVGVVVEERQADGAVAIGIRGEEVTAHEQRIEHILLEAPAVVQDVADRLAGIRDEHLHELAAGEGDERVEHPAQHAHDHGRRDVAEPEQVERRRSAEGGQVGLERRDRGHGRLGVGAERVGA